MSSSVDEYLNKYVVGFPTFIKLFCLNKENLIKILKDIFSDNEKILKLLDDNPNIYKNIENDKPNEISICSWDTITINATGINFIPEHGISETLIQFNKFFVIDVEDSGGILKIETPKILK